MIKQLDLMLDGEGIVVFDPCVLVDFLQEKKITTPNLFDLFNQEAAIGDEVIKRGIILPIYTIPPLDYQIIVNERENSSVRPDWVRFTTPPFPLTVGECSKIVAADIYSIMDWDSDFYKRLPLNGPKAPQAATTVSSGKYGVVIKGFAEREYVGRGPKNIGYELLLEKVATLPAVAQDVDIDSFDFVLWQPGQPSN